MKLNDDEKSFYYVLMPIVYYKEFKDFIIAIDYLLHNH